MATIRLRIEYDGTDFSGWQSQTNGRTVQDEVESAIASLTGESIRIVGGGRTDAGVHATGQVASFQLAGEVDPEKLRRGLNGLLPVDVRIVDAAVADPTFNARYSARSRTYRYRVVTRESPLLRRVSWQVHWRLDVGLMQECAEMFRGEDDFRSFAKVGSDVDHFRCIVTEAVWLQREESLDFRVTSNRFLYGMVRAMVGTMVNVGRGYTPIGDVRSILESKDRGNAGMAAPAQGLCLEYIAY